MREDQKVASLMSSMWSMKKSKRKREKKIEKSRRRKEVRKNELQKERRSCWKSKKLTIIVNHKLRTTYLQKRKKEKSVNEKRKWGKGIQSFFLLFGLINLNKAVR